MNKFSIDTATPEECADFLFRFNAKRLIKRWWGARTAHTPNTTELAGDVLNLILAPDPWPDGPEKIHPYVVKQLGTAIPVSKTQALDINDVVRLASQDCGW